jgi:type IV secretory pathway TrbD component
MTDTRDPGHDDRPPPVHRNLARQGVSGHNVRAVLMFGTAAVVIAFVIVYLAFFAL